MEWNKVSEKELPFGKEVIAFNKEWINLDFNPNGTRVGSCKTMVLYRQLGIMMMIVMIHAMKKEMTIIRAFPAFQEQRYIINNSHYQICQHIG